MLADYGAPRSVSSCDDTSGAVCAQLQVEDVMRPFIRFRGHVAVPARLSSFSARHRRRLSLERLEPRNLLSILWDNRGTTSDTDHFDQYFGADADYARQLVDRAIADWNKIIGDFHYVDVDTQNGPHYDYNFHLTLNATPMDLSYGDEASDVLSNTILLDSDRLPYAATVIVDDDGDIYNLGTTWQFLSNDTLLDDAGFTKFTSPFESRYMTYKKEEDYHLLDESSRDAGPLDLLRSVRHEIGHAVGFIGQAADAASTRLNDIQGRTNDNADYVDPVDDWQDYSKYEAVVYRPGFEPNDQYKYQIMFTRAATLAGLDLEEGYLPFFDQTYFTDHAHRRYNPAAAYALKPNELFGETPWPADPQAGPPEPKGGPTHLNDLLSEKWTIDSDRTVRQQISDLDAMILADAYGYDINFPSRVDTMYAELREELIENVATNTLYVRGGDIDSFLDNTVTPKNDKINIYKDTHNTTTTADDEIVVEVNEFSWVEWDEANSQYTDPPLHLPTQERFPASQVQRILIESRGNEQTGQDEIVIGQSAGDPGQSPVSGPLLAYVDVEIRNTEHATFTVIDSQIDLSLASSKLDATLTSSSVHLQSNATFGTVSISANSELAMSAGDKWIDVEDELSIDAAGTLDLNTSDMILRAGAQSLSAVSAWIATGANQNGFLTWTGHGINSSAAASDPYLITAVGVMKNDNGLGGAFYNTFNGRTVGATDILVKYTYYGDCDLSGSVDGNDYALIDNGFNAQNLFGWFNGDVDHDGDIDGTDYALMDNAFYSQFDPL